MFDPAAGFRARFVALFFPVGQRLATNAFAMNPTAVTLRFKTFFGAFGAKSTIGPNGRSAGHDVRIGNRKGRFGDLSWLLTRLAGES